MDSFAFGGAASVILDSPIWRRHLTRFAPIALAPALALFLLSYFLSTAMWTTIGLTSLSLFFTCLIVCAVTYQSSPWLWGFRSKPLRILGKYSYSLYIFHVPIQLYFLHKVPLDLTIHYFHSVLLALTFRVLFVGTLSIGVALITWNVIEQPILRLKRHFEPSLDSTRACSPDRNGATNVRYSME